MQKKSFFSIEKIKNAASAQLCSIEKLLKKFQIENFKNFRSA